MNWNKLRDWIQQPTTLVGLALTASALTGVGLGALNEALGCTILTGAIPLLIPDNTGLQAKADAAAVPLVHALAQHAASVAAGAAVGAVAGTLAKSETDQPATPHDLFPQTENKGG
ncbi:hypothetical protein [Gluconobacter oxydans]|uniref:Holin n=1 Tax=Gluconobacter oxydans NBRC 3293 TaxID=1315969 RepID=A0A829WXW1_GLUOY|nr:hypothetical protein [Gluconobacter oxydans]GEM17963.1 hypothetical protein NBRC3293_2460 [Gluconobacter oxydans NBRC 3293]